MTARVFRVAQEDARKAPGWGVADSKAGWSDRAESIATTFSVAGSIRLNQRGPKSAERIGPILPVKDSPASSLGVQVTSNGPAESHPMPMASIRPGTGTVAVPSSRAEARSKRWTNPSDG